MSSQDAEEAWDFTPVIDLNCSLSSRRETRATSSSPSSEDILTPDSEYNYHDHGGELGNFNKIWEFLGQPNDLAPPVVPPSVNGDLGEPGEGAIEQDETIFELSTSKGVRWRDEEGGRGLVDAAENLALDSTLQLSKARRKKLRAKKAANSKRWDKSGSNVLTSSSETENDSNERVATPVQNRTSIIHQLIHGTTLGSGGTTHKDIESARLAVSTHRYPLRSLFKSPEAPLKNDTTSREVYNGDIAAKTKKLIAMLHDRFVSERVYLGNLGLSPFAKRIDVSPETGLHVFIDASNIMIGLHDSFKISRGLSIASHIRRQPISFHNLSIVLERGRPTAKRVLVGSDNFPAIQEAKLLGYETNILDRVHKAKELTPRQRKYHNANGATSSGSETTAAVYAPEKWVEQAVDEILHLKILESVVDAEKPSTIVLATGDAAEAEYSQGFLKMVERALGKGWKVEVCSFKKNISGAYRKKEFRSRWATQFKIIEMDDFVEELIGVE